MNSFASSMVVSVLMPVYNGQKYLESAISSVLNQTLRDLELIIVDDGSTDGTAGILSAVADPRVRVLHNNSNLGVAKSLNRAIGLAQGTFIARMDADDLALPHRLERQVRFLNHHPNVAIVGSSVRCIGMTRSRVRYWRGHAHIQAQCLFNSPFAHPTVCWRRSDFELHQLRYQEEPPTAEDYELWERACCGVRVANLPEPLLYYRMDPSIKVSAYLRQQLAGGRMVRERLLHRAGFALDAPSLELLHKIGEGTTALSLEILHQASALFAELLRQQQARPWFETQALRGVISRQLRWLMVRHAAALSRGELLRFSKDALRNQLLKGGDFMRWLVQLARTKPANTAGIPSSL